MAKPTTRMPAGERSAVATLQPPKTDQREHNNMPGDFFLRKYCRKRRIVCQDNAVKETHQGIRVSMCVAK